MVVHYKLTSCVVAERGVSISSLYRCKLKSHSSAAARFLKIAQPVTETSGFVSVMICCITVLTSLSLRSIFRHFPSSIKFKIALAARDRDFVSRQASSRINGRIFCSRIAANSGSTGGFGGRIEGLSGSFCRFFLFDLPMIVLR